MMILSHSYLCFFLSLLFSTLAASPTLQMDALLDFKNEFPNIAQDPYARSDYSLSSWNTSNTDFCSWKHVTCDAKSNKVISLNLNSISLSGSLKANTSLLKLQHLRNLTLNYCDLIGEIPSSLGNLSNLIALDLSVNHLVGKIPASIGNLRQLKYLSFAFNNLIGNIPSSLGNLSNLIIFYLSENHLTGQVPPSIGNLNQLTLLSFSSNNLSGNIPVSFAKFNKLSYLFLSQNQFTSGDFPLVLPNLTSLSRFYIGHNHFKSKLASNMSGFHNLVGFDVSGNSFVGDFPTSLFTIPSLQAVSLRENKFEGPLVFGNTSSYSKLVSLDLSSNNFYGPIPESISRFLNLSTLDLSHNRMSGPIPGSMSKLFSQSFSPYLDLSYNKLEGQVPSFLWRLYLLKLSHNSFSSLERSMEVAVNGMYFDLGSNSLQGLFPQWICKFSFLQFLDLSNNHLTGSIPSCLMNFMASLRDLNLRNNNFSGLLPEIFTNATQLRSLDVSGNQLVGKLPKSLSNCKSMEFLNLKRNKIEDTFPYWLKPMGSLRVLLLGSNAFYGPIYNPSAYFGLSTLRVIDISRNSFNGTLPHDYFENWLEMSSVSINETEWSRHIMSEVTPYSINMGKINNYEDSMEMMYKGVETEFSKIFLAYKAIDFSGNKLKGQIPKSIGLLKGLLLLNLSGNAFTGNIPSYLANITNLEALDLSWNKLTGQIPRELSNLHFLAYLDFSHNLLEGLVPQSTQFQRQNCSSFKDNLGLYGLEQICGQIHKPDTTSKQPEEALTEEEEEEHVFSWIAAAIAFGPGVFCGFVIGLIFYSQKRDWLMKTFCINNPSGTRYAR